MVLEQVKVWMQHQINYVYIKVNDDFVLKLQKMENEFEKKNIELFIDCGNYKIYLRERSYENMMTSAKVGP